ncbi:MAG: hypothetical protein RIR17_2494, partial [Planctomycetota bacterium]
PDGYYFRGQIFQYLKMEDLANEDFGKAKILRENKNK